MDTISSGEDIEEKVAEKEKMGILGRRLGEFKRLLSEKERFILENRILAEEPVTLREIGDRFNTSRESIRQMQTKIAKSLARNLRSSELRLLRIESTAARKSLLHGREGRAQPLPTFLQACSSGTKSRIVSSLFLFVSFSSIIQACSSHAKSAIVLIFLVLFFL